MGPERSPTPLRGRDHHSETGAGRVRLQGLQATAIYSAVQHGTGSTLGLSSIIRNYRYYANDCYAARLVLSSNCSLEYFTLPHVEGGLQNVLQTYPLGVRLWRKAGKGCVWLHNELAITMSYIRGAHSAIT